MGLKEEILERYEAWWEGEGTILKVSAPRQGYVAPRLPSQVQDVGWLLAWAAQRWVREGEEPDWDWIWEMYLLHLEGTYFGGDSYPQVWLNLGPGVMAAYLEGHMEFRGDTVWFELPDPLNKENSND